MKPEPPPPPPPPQSPIFDRTRLSQPLELVAEDEDEKHDARYFHVPIAPPADVTAPAPKPPESLPQQITPSQPSATQNQTTAEALQWALDSMQQPAIAAADWLARDIDPQANSAAELLSNPAITLTQIRQAKSAFKTMRIVGEKSADRRVGARMYAAAIAAGLVRFSKRVSSQSDDAMERAFQGLLDDRKMPNELRDLAGQALCALKNSQR